MSRRNSGYFVSHPVTVLPRRNYGVPYCEMGTVPAGPFSGRATLPRKV